MSKLVFLSRSLGSSASAGVQFQDELRSGMSLLKEMWTSASTVGYLYGQVSQLLGLLILT